MPLCYMPVIGLLWNLDLRANNMVHPRRAPRKAYTLVELIIVLLLLFVAAGAGTSLDLSDLVDAETYLKAEGVGLETDALIDELVKQSTAEPPDEFEAANRRLFRMQVISRELGRRKANEARTALGELANSQDYFVAKHAKSALEMLSGKEPPRTPLEVPDELQGLLPDDCKLSVSLPGDGRANLLGLAGAFRVEFSNAIPGIVEKIGNVEIQRVVVLSGDNTKPPGRVQLILVEGRFDQARIVEQLIGAGAESSQQNESLWVGTMDFPYHESPMRIALIDSRRAAIAMDATAFDADTLLKLATSLDSGE